MRATNLHGQSSRKWPEKDSVFFKLQGQSTESLAETRKIVQEIVTNEGCTSFSMADSPEQAEEIWADRKNARKRSQKF
jgi:D-lactate dehydrogenase (cytochrome)